MAKWIFRKYFFLIALFLLLPLQTKADAIDGDFMLWTQVEYHHRFAESPLEILFIGKNRLDDHVTRYSENQTFFGITYHLLEWVQFGFLQGVIKEPSNPTEYRPTLEAVLVGKVGNWKFTGRNLFENRLSDEYRFRYRLKLKIGPKLKTRLVSFSPFVANEIFLQNIGGFNQNRAEVGNSFGFLQDRIRFVLYYLLRSDQQSNGWIHRHVLGTTLKFYY